MINRYYEGRLARAAGRPRALADGRCSPKTRAAFYGGWDDEDAIRARVIGGALAVIEAGATPAEVAKFKADMVALVGGGLYRSTAERLNG
jgi:hypothetical protein